MELYALIALILYFLPYGFALALLILAVRLVRKPKNKSVDPFASNKLALMVIAGIFIPVLYTGILNENHSDPVSIIRGKDILKTDPSIIDDIGYPIYAYDNALNDIKFQKVAYELVRYDSSVVFFQTLENSDGSGIEIDVGKAGPALGEETDFAEIVGMCGRGEIKFCHQAGTSKEDTPIFRYGDYKYYATLTGANIIVEVLPDSANEVSVNTEKEMVTVINNLQPIRKTALPGLIKRYYNPLF